MKRLLLSLVMLSVCFTGCSSNYSDGSRVGVLRKFSRKGVLIKSWEGELLLNAGMKDDGKGQQMVVNETWEFSVDPEASHGEDIKQVVQDLKAALKSGKRVELYYNQNTWPLLRISTDYCIYKVEVLN